MDAFDLSSYCPHGDKKKNTPVIVEVEHKGASKGQPSDNSVNVDIISSTCTKHMNDNSVNLISLFVTCFDTRWCSRLEVENFQEVERTWGSKTTTSKKVNTKWGSNTSFSWTKDANNNLT